MRLALLAFAVTASPYLSTAPPNYADMEAPVCAGQVCTLKHAPNPAASLMLFSNGLLLHRNSGWDYTLTGNVITLQKATAGDLLAWYRY